MVLAAWGITALLTLAAALTFGELAAMMPRAGGQYVYLREAFSPLAGFLYGWTLFAVIQTGTLIVLGVILGANTGAVSTNFSAAWTPAGVNPVAPGVDPSTLTGLLIALAVAQVGSLFASEAWNNITFTASEVKNPRRDVPLSLVFGTGLVMGLYLLANVAYFVTLSVTTVQTVPSDRVAAATLEAIWPGLGGMLMAAGIMVSTFGCANGLVLTGGVRITRWP